MKKKFTVTMTNTITNSAPASVWGKGVPGKGGKTNNSAIVENTTDTKQNN